MSSSSDKIFPIFGVSDESYEKSQLRYQMLCDDDMLTDSILASTATEAAAEALHIKSKTASIPINKSAHNSSKVRASPQSQGSSKSRSFNSLIGSIPMRLRQGENSSKEKTASPKKTSGSYLTEKFRNNTKKKSESEDFVLV